MLIKGDELIHMVAEKLAFWLGHDSDQFAHIRCKLRELGRLVIEYRKTTLERNASLNDLIAPSKINKVVEATLKVSGFDENKHLYSTPSLALKIGHSLRKAAEVLLAHAFTGSDEVDSVLESRCERFIRLYNMKWRDMVSSHALRTLGENKHNNPQILPLTSDVVKLTTHLQDRMKECIQALKTPQPNTEHWQNLAEVCLASVLVFNRKRSGEVSKMKVTDFDKCRNGKEGCSSVKEGLSEWEQTLCNTMWRMEIRGKKDRTGPVLLTDDMHDGMQMLMMLRGKIEGLLEENEYFFPLLGSLGHVCGCNMIRKHAGLCGASNPSISSQHG